MKKIVLVLLGVGVVTLVASRFSTGSSESAVPESSIFAVKKGTLAISLTETGVLNTKNAANVRAETDGSAKIAWLIDEGAAVKSGDVVVELDKTEAEKRVEELENQRIQSESDLKGAKTDREVQASQNKTEFEKAQLALDVARFNLRKLTEGDIPAEKSKRQLRINKAETELQKQDEKYKTLPGLLDQGFVTKAQVEEGRLKVDEAKVELESAKQDMDLYVKFQEPLDTKQKTAEVTQAEREVERVQKRSESQLEAKDAVVLQRELSLKRTNKAITDLKDKLGRMTLRAPTPGVVVYGDPAQPWYEERIKVGGEVWRNMVIVTIPDSRELTVQIQVHEADVNAIQSGMATSVTLDTYKGLILKGSVTKVAAVASQGGWREEGVKKFQVNIGIIGSDLNLRPGITAKAEIAIGEMKDVLYVPLQAIKVKEGKHRVFVRSLGKTTASEVEIGRSNDHYVEVKKGLKECEQVLLYDPAGEATGEGNPNASPSPAAAAPEAPGTKP